ncbi:MAG: D-alanine--D-alanine ligase [Leptospira sp.]|nr:D-alanine--D-alanine ligase [Leptospira sp.]
MEPTEMKQVFLACDIYDPKIKANLLNEWESEKSVEILNKTISDFGYFTKTFSSPNSLMQSLLDIPNEKKKDVLVFNLIEGYLSPNREGYIPSICEYLGFPHSGSSAFSQSLTLNKFLTQTLAKQIGIPTATLGLLERSNWEETLENLNPSLFPVFVKPNGEGSSIGITESNIIRNKESNLRVRELISEYGEVLLETFLEGREATIGILGNFPNYTSSKVFYVNYPNHLFCESTKGKGEPPETLEGISDNLIQRQIQNYAIRIAKQFKISGYCRIDFKWGKDSPYLLDVNGTPGFSKIYSLFPKLWESSGIEYETLISRCIELGFADYEENRRFLYGKRYHESLY